MAGAAFEANFAPHQLAQLFADHEAQACAAVFPRGRCVDLRKGVEEAIETAFRDADAAVLDRDLDESRLIAVFHAHHADDDAAVLGELDGVIQQVGHNLAEPSRIPDEPQGETRVDEVGHFERFFATPGGHQLDDRFDHFVEVEWNLLDIEPTRLDLREIEDLVQQFEQRLAREFRRLHIFALLRVERRHQQQVGHADDAVERRAQLVRDIGQELALGAVGGLGLDAGRVELAIVIGQLFLRFRQARRRAFPIASCGRGRGLRGFD